MKFSFPKLKWPSFHFLKFHKHEWFKVKFGKWNYLGHTRISYTNKRGKETDHLIIHFYAKGSELQVRKVTRIDDKYYWSKHDYYQTVVVPWLRDPEHNLYNPIHFPSEWLKNYTKNRSGHEFVDSKWVKPAPNYEKTGNVIRIPSNS